MINTKAYATLVTEHILFWLFNVIFLVLINVIFVNIVKVTSLVPKNNLI